MKSILNNINISTAFNHIIAPYNVNIRVGNAICQIGRGSFSSINNIILSRNDLIIEPRVILKIGQYIEINKSSRIICGYSEHLKDNEIYNTFSNSLHLKKIIKQKLPDIKTTIIGNNVILSQNSVVLSGSYIKDNSIVGACCLVNKEVEENSLVVGVPAKKIKNINRKFDWWNLEEEEIINYFNNNRYLAKNWIPKTILMTAEISDNSLMHQLKIEGIMKENNIYPVSLLKEHHIKYLAQNGSENSIIVSDEVFDDLK
jgi:acetyltransferase-like isoleucine patch superfamily enzyme